MKAINPQAFQVVEKAMQNQNNPLELFKQITNGRTPEQMNNFYNRVEKMGFSPDLINQFKNGINSKLS